VGAVTRLKRRQNYIYARTVNLDFIPSVTTNWHFPSNVVWRADITLFYPNRAGGAIKQGKNLHVRTSLQCIGRCNHANGTHYWSVVLHVDLIYRILSKSIQKYLKYGRKYIYALWRSPVFATLILAELRDMTTNCKQVEREKYVHQRSFTCVGVRGRVSGVRQSET